jgi:hypothetical protein
LRSVSISSSELRPLRVEILPRSWSFGKANQPTRAKTVVRRSRSRSGAAIDLMPSSKKSISHPQIESAGALSANGGSRSKPGGQNRTWAEPKCNL